MNARTPVPAGIGVASDSSNDIVDLSEVELGLSRLALTKLSYKMASKKLKLPESRAPQMIESLIEKLK